MKKLILGISLLLISVFSFAQGLENIIVEKYYVSNAADSVAASAAAVAAIPPQAPGGLPAHSVTYRIYADLLPGYKFQGLYGELSPAHTSSITTSTSFYNHPAGNTNQASTTKG